MNFVDSRNMFGNGPTKEIPCLTGKGKPTTATEGAVGCLYMDTDSGAVYKCTAASDGVYTWVDVLDSAEMQRVIEAYLEENPPADGKDGGYYTPVFTENEPGFLQVSLTPSKADMPAVPPTAFELPSGSSGAGGNAALTPEERSTLIAVVNAIGVFNVSNGQELVSAFNSAWSGDTPDDPDPDEPVVPDDPDQPAENLFRMGEKFVNTTHTSEIEWEDYGCSWKSAGYWSQSCTMIGLEAGKTYTMFADATVGGDAPTAGSYVTAKVVSWKDTPGVNGNGFSDLAVFYPSPAMSDWPGYAEFTVPADVQAVGLAFVGSSTSRTNRIYNVAVYEGSMTARP